MASASTSDHHPMPTQATRNGATAILLDSSADRPCGNGRFCAIETDPGTRPEIGAQFVNLNVPKSTALIDQAWRSPRRAFGFQGLRDNVIIWFGFTWRFPNNTAAAARAGPDRAPK